MSHCPPSLGKRIACLLLVLAAWIVGSAGVASAQQGPEIGYMYPPGGQAGQTVEVLLGGYDWTPDMQIFVHDSRIKLEITGTPGEVIVPEPPYWFGKKARRGPFLMPRETLAKLTIPANVPPGIYSWQVANANGASKPGYFIVGSFTEVMEDEEITIAQKIEALPVTINGQVKVTEDVDQYQFQVAKTGPVTCLVSGRKLGLDLNAILKVYDESGKLVADAADTAGRDLAMTFHATAGKSYTAHIYDADFRGNRAFVYRLTLAPGPHVEVAIPPTGKRGTTQPVEFVGYGLKTGAAKLESVTQNVQFPADPALKKFAYTLETPHGTAFPFELKLSDDAPPVRSTATAGKPMSINLPIAVAGVLQTQYGEDRYQFSATKGDAWALSVAGEEIGSSLDVDLAVLDAEGNEIARSDDAGGTTDAALMFTAKADGDYTLVISDISGESGKPTALYLMTAEPVVPDFELSLIEQLSINIGTEGKLALKATRLGGFNDVINLSFKGLPAGITLPEDMTIPEKKPSANLVLTASADAAATAALVTLVAEAKVGEQTVRKEYGPMLLALTLTPPFEIQAEGLDDVTKWPRGTTFPGPVLITRKDGFNGEIVLEMSAKQGRTRMGIHGPELVVAPGVERVLYPIFLPEWLETTRTSRMIVNGVAKIPDPKGNIRYSSSKILSRIGFLPTGALLTLDAGQKEFNHVSGQPLEIPISISHTSELTESLKLELIAKPEDKGLFSAEPLTVTSDQTSITLPVKVNSDMPEAATLQAGERKLTIRATALKEGHLPVVSETSVIVIFGAETSGR